MFVFFVVLTYDSRKRKSITPEVWNNNLFLPVHIDFNIQNINFSCRVMLMNNILMENHQRDSANKSACLCEKKPGWNGLNMSQHNTHPI